MGKRKYIKPEIREESYILTVRAWVTTTVTSVALQQSTNTSVAFQRTPVNRTNVALQNVVVGTSVANQNRIARQISG